MHHTILFLDDDKSILTAIKRVFLNQEYTVHTFNSGDEALAAIKENTYSVIVSDMKMPNMDGIQFLEKAQALSPHSTRIILSAYADIDTVMNAINTGHIWHYITKPWDNFALISTIKTAVEFYSITHERDQLIKDLKQLNITLEEKVQARTAEIDSISILQNMLLQNISTEIILQKALSMLSNLFPNSELHIHEKITGITHSQTDTFLSEKTINKLSHFYDSPSEEVIDTFKCIPLKCGETLVGILLNNNDLSNIDDDTQKHLLSIISIISLTLSFCAASKDTSGMIQTIDGLLGEL